MAKVAIVHHSGFGHTQRVAEHVAQGAAAVAGTQVSLQRVDALDLEPLHAADAIVFGAPTYMGSASAGFKTFMEATSRLWLQQRWKDKLAAGFTNSGSLYGDKANALVELCCFAAQHGMVWVSLGQLVSGVRGDRDDPRHLNRLGSSLGLMTQADIDRGPELAPPASDLETARVFGRRIAELAARWLAGQTGARG
jgi:NAD(P)H dehydrogenase (quinone)